MKPEELTKLTAYFRRTFNNPGLTVKKRPQKTDSAEVYLGEEFIGAGDGEPGVCAGDLA